MFLWCRYLGRLDPGYSQHTALATIGRTQSISFLTHDTLQMKGRRESNINAWSHNPFMYFQKWNCAPSLFPPCHRMFSIPAPTLIYLWEIYIFPRSVCLSILLRQICGPILEIYISLTDTWIWKLGLRRRIIRKGIHKWDFHCGVY
jgi:hypothetical protein